MQVSMRKVLGDSMSSQMADTIRSVIEALGRRAEQAERERDEARAELVRLRRHRDATAEVHMDAEDEVGRLEGEVERLRDEVAKLKFARHLGIVSGLEENEG
jgi:HAMP domain-containing protein